MSDHLLDELEDGRFEPEVRVVTRHQQPTVEELRKRRDAVKRAFNQGHTIEQLMEMFDLPRDTVRRDIYSPSDNTPDHVRVRRDKIRRLYEQGHQTPLEVARQLFPGETITVARRNMVRADLRMLGFEGVYDQRIADRNQRLKAMHEEGMSFNEVVEASGLSQSQVRTAYRSLGLPLPRDVLAQRREQVLALRLEGKSSGLIAETVGAGLSTIADDLRVLVAEGRLPADLRPTLTAKRTRTEKRRAGVLELYPTGMPIIDIATRLDASDSTISSDVTHLKRKGLLVGRSEDSPRLGVSRSNTTGTNVIPLVDNAVTHMGQMADVLLNGDISTISDATEEQWKTWEKALTRVKRAVTYVRRNQPNNQGD